MNNKLLVSDATLGPGGAERVLSILSEGFANHYNQVIYLTWNDVPDFYSIDSRVKRICVERECGSKNIIKKALWFRKFVKQESPSLVLSFLTPYNVITCTSLLGINVPMIVAERNDPRYVWNSFPYREIRSLIYHKPMGILQQTENNKAYYKGSLYDKTSVIFNPIVMGDDYRGKALQTPKKKRIVSVARLMKQKNQNMLLKAFKIFHDTHPDYTLTIYGKGNYRNEVEKLVSQYGLEGYVELPGPVNDLWDRIIDAECFALSSWYEGMPNGLLEALCLGLPCVSTKVSGAVDLIRNNENGILVDLDDHVSMAKAFASIIDNKANAEKIGQQATKTYEKLNVDVISKQWINIIDKYSK